MNEVASTQEKLKSGDVYQVAEVVRNLAARNRDASLSAAERTMYDRARINLISEIAVPISLCLRLFANVQTGTVMMALIYGLLGVIATAWPAALHVYFDLFSGAIQTYVFCMLTMTYIANARGDA